MATVLPTECLTAPALCLCRTGSGWNESHATPRSPLPDALGGTRVSSVPGLDPSARDRGQRCRARLLETFNKEIARTPSKLTGEYTRSDEGATIAAGRDQASRPHQGGEVSSRRPVVPESAAARSGAGYRS